MRSLVAASLFLVGLASAQSLPHFVDAAPFGLPGTTTAPESSGETPERVALGKRLFFDVALSRTREISCASCHDPKHGWADPRSKSLGVEGRQTTNHAPTLFNRAFGAAFMWDGRASTLEEQVLQPIENPLEMDLPINEALARIAADVAYVRDFEVAWNTKPDRETLARSLAVFVRKIQIGNSPIDRFRSGKFDKPLSPEERTGLWIYESKGRCWRCHSGPNFTDEEFHNTGIGAVDGQAAEGRLAVTKNAADRGRFKTPTLRGLAFTAPYMHDGSLATLADVVAFYRDGGHANSGLDRHIAPIDLSDREAAGLLAFLEALSREAD